MNTVDLTGRERNATVIIPLNDHVAIHQPRVSNFNIQVHSQGSHLVPAVEGNNQPILYDCGEGSTQLLNQETSLEGTSTEVYSSPFVEDSNQPILYDSGEGSTQLLNQGTPLEGTNTEVYSSPFVVDYENLDAEELLAGSEDEGVETQTVQKHAILEAIEDDELVEQLLQGPDIHTGTTGSDDQEDTDFVDLGNNLFDESETTHIQAKMLEDTRILEVVEQAVIDGISAAQAEQMSEDVGSKRKRTVDLDYSQYSPISPASVETVENDDVFEAPHTNAFDCSRSSRENTCASKDQNKFISEQETKEAVRTIVRMLAPQEDSTATTGTCNKKRRLNTLPIKKRNYNNVYATSDTNLFEVHNSENVRGPITTEGQINYSTLNMSEDIERSILSKKYTRINQNNILPSETRYHQGCKLMETTMVFENDEEKYIIGTNVCGSYYGYHKLTKIITTKNYLSNISSESNMLTMIQQNPARHECIRRNCLPVVRNELLNKLHSQVNREKMLYNVNGVKFRGLNFCNPIHKSYYYNLLTHQEKMECQNCPYMNSLVENVESYTTPATIGTLIAALEELHCFNAASADFIDLHNGFPLTEDEYLQLYTRQQMHTFIQQKTDHDYSYCEYLIDAASVTVSEMFNHNHVFHHLVAVTPANTVYLITPSSIVEKILAWAIKNNKTTKR